MSDVPATNPSPPTSERKAASNKRNASKSTGPKTAQGKSWSRLNALKHGILASQTVLTTVEGREERAAFEQLVDGLAHDFAPVGTFEQVLVQQVAACLWRQRRLLMFENRTAFESREKRTFIAMNEPEPVIQPQYLYQGERFDGDDIVDKAGLGLDLPSERDMMRLVRYEASITRSLRNALAQLKTRQAARRESGPSAYRAPAYDDRKVVMDKAAGKRNRGPGSRRMTAKASRFAIGVEMREEEEEEARAEAEEAASSEASSPASENYQTKPNTAEDPEAMLRGRQLMEAADAVLKLRASLAPKPRPSGD
jgi:hypothetical protein